MSERSDAEYELDVRKRIEQMREDDLVDFIRDTVTQLEVLADRLEARVSEQEDSGND